MLFSDASLDLWKERYGYHEVTSAGINDRNILFMNFTDSGRVEGYGVTHPGAILEQIMRFRDDEHAESAAAEQARSPVQSGLLTALICAAAVESLEGVEEECTSVVQGKPRETYGLLARKVGSENARVVYHGHS